MPDLSRVNAIVKTFLRDEHMKACVRSIIRHYPEIKIVLVDDGEFTKEKTEFYKSLRREGHVVEDYSLAFDSGFGAKSNLATALCTREYVLTVNDDFVFDGNTDGVREMVMLLDHLSEVGLVCGTWCNQDYQGWLKRTPGRVEEIPFPKNSTNYEHCAGVPYKLLDLCAVYGVFRRKVFSESGVRWDARYKIGGEHGDWFMDIADAGWKIAFTPSANINQITNVQPHSAYHGYRMRNDWREHYVNKHGPHTYKYFNGSEDRF